MDHATRVVRSLTRIEELGAPIVALDASLVAAGALAAFTTEVVLWFHVIFVLLTLAALVLALRQVLWRVALWVPLVVVFILRAASAGTTTASELIEIPLLTVILVLVYLGAERRQRTVAELQATQAELERRSQLERAEFERQLARAQKLEAFGQLSLSLVHDFNNVVTALLGGVEDLTEALAGRDEQHIALELFEQLQRARSLMDELTGFVREPATGVMRSDLCEVIEDLRPTLVRLTRDEASLEVDSSARSAIVPLARSQVDQIVMNLMLNALDAIRPGGRIRVETRDSQRSSVAPRGAGEIAPPGVTLAVIDDGAGIAPDVLASVFEPGFSTKGEPRNLGMGLASVLRIVEGGDGIVEIDSDLGRGTAVRIWLPTILSTASPGSDVIPHREELPSGTETILVAEDDAPVRNRVAGILRSAGYRVVSASDGEDAMHAAAGATIEGLVTDVSMPRRGGVALAAELRRQYSELPVLLISGYAVDSEIGALDAPASWLRKPFTRAELLHAVRALFDGRRPIGTEPG